MRIVYLVPSIANEGGVARVLSTKANYLVQKLGHEVHIITQNKGNVPLFYHFDAAIFLHDILLTGNPFAFLWSYQKALSVIFKKIQPDSIIVADNGLKGYLVPWLFPTKTPIFFESHGSKFIQEQASKNTFFGKLTYRFSILLKIFCAKKFDSFIVLSEASLQEWKLHNALVIPNPLATIPVKKTNLQSKKVIVVARNTYEKGLDRLLPIWQKTSLANPDWTLEIYGNQVTNGTLLQLAKALQTENSVRFYEPVKNIEAKYQEAAVVLMTSRSEGLPMVLLEAMAVGLPAIAYDCPCGPRAIITEGENGFLIPDGNKNVFVAKLSLLLQNEVLRVQMGNNASKITAKYDLETVMLQWQNLFETWQKKTN